MTLTQIAPNLWVDLSTVVAVHTYIDPHSYARKVRLDTTTGANYTVTAYRHANGGPHQPASVGDEALAAWRDEHLAHILKPQEQEQAPRCDHVSPVRTSKDYWSCRACGQEGPWDERPWQNQEALRDIERRLHIKVGKKPEGHGG